jgi:hypothetical protein
MALLSVVRAASMFVVQTPGDRILESDSQAKVPSVSGHYPQISVLVAVVYRCCGASQRDNSDDDWIDNTYVSALGWNAGAVGLSFAAESSCGCGVADFRTAASLAPLTGAGFGGSGTCAALVYVVVFRPGHLHYGICIPTGNSSQDP